MNSLDRSRWRSLCGRTKIYVFKALILPVWLFSCETQWTQSCVLESGLTDNFECLIRALGHSPTEHRRVPGPFLSVVFILGPSCMASRALNWHYKLSLEYRQAFRATHNLTVLPYCVYITYWTEYVIIVSNSF